MFFWKKSIREIVAKHRAHERAIVEKFYTEELKKLRSENMKRLNDLELEYDKSKKVIIKQKEVELNQLRDQIKNTQAAWKYILEFMPKIIQLSNMLKIKADVEIKNFASEFKHIAMIDNDLESLNRKLTKSIPQIERLLGEQIER
jgi:hypothetical protein